MANQQHYTKLWVHLVWATKHRQPIMDKTIKWDIFNHIKENSKDKDYWIDHINGMEDHVHCLVGLKPTLSVSKIVNLIKGESSNWTNKQGLISDQAFEWQDGYSAFTVGYSTLNQVRSYIRRQEQHHKQKSYDDEIQELK